MSGWVKLHRKLLEWEWYHDNNCARVFLHLLLTVNHKPGRYAGHDVPAGARVTGYPSLAEECGLTVQQLRTVFSKLKSTGEITVKAYTKFSIVSITNWDDHQADNSQINSAATGEQHSSNRRATTSKEGKKERKEEKNKVERPADVDPDLWSDFLSHRRAQRATLTKTALNGFEREAKKANLSLPQAIQIAIERGWRGFKADWIKPEDRPKPQLVHSNEKVQIAVHDEPELFDAAMNWSLQHVRGFQESGQEILTVPAHVAENLRKHVRRTA